MDALPRPTREQIGQLDSTLGEVTRGPRWRPLRAYFTHEPGQHAGTRCGGRGIASANWLLAYQRALNYRGGAARIGRITARRNRPDNTQRASDEIAVNQLVAICRRSSIR